MFKSVEEVLDEIRPNLQADGGDVELVDVKNGRVFVKLKGACSGCPMAQVTLRMGIERLLKEKVKGFKELQEVKG